MISSNLLPVYADSTIFNIDQVTPLFYHIFIGKIERGSGIRKINNSLLKDEDLINKIKKENNLIVSTYACTPYNHEFISNYGENDIELMIGIYLGCTSCTSKGLDN